MEIIKKKTYLSARAKETQFRRTQQEQTRIQEACVAKIKK